MHKRIGADVLALDIKLERTLRNLKKERAVETVMVEDREGNKNTPFVADRPQQRQRIMEDFWRSMIRDECSTFKQLTIEANNF